MVTNSAEAKSRAKTITSAWAFSCVILIVIKIFEKIVSALVLHQELNHTAYLVTYGIFGILFLVALGGIMAQKRWGLSLVAYAAVLDILVESFTGGWLSSASVAVSLLILLSAFFVYRRKFDK